MQRKQSFLDLKAAEKMHHLIQTLGFRTHCEDQGDWQGRGAEESMFEKQEEEEKHFTLREMPSVFAPVR